jgi:hypothetical protein
VHSYTLLWLWMNRRAVLGWFITQEHHLRTTPGTVEKHLPFQGFGCRPSEYTRLDSFASQFPLSDHCDHCECRRARKTNDFRPD